ncbi:Pathogen-associated molecular patterns-induced protein A70 [Linum grandiflorum]
MSSWLTPTVLFLFLNIMIGTIAITSSLASPKPNHNEHQHQQQQQQQLWRSPSVLQRLKSINLYSYRSQEPQISTLQSSNKVVGRSMSDTKPVGGEIPKKLPKKMKKSASTKSAFGHFEEEKIVEARRPATVREQKSNKLIKEDEDEDEEEDAKADDFINKFKQQLKLQRLDSIIRYKEMVGRGSTK